MRTWNSMNGLNNMSYHLRVLLIIMGLYTATSLADTEEEKDILSMEFLEFLSDWETDQGDWVGPGRFEDNSFDQLYEVEKQEYEEQSEE